MKQMNLIDIVYHAALIAIVLIVSMIVVTACATNPSIFSKRSDAKKPDDSPAPPGPDQQGIFNFSFQTVQDVAGKSGYATPLLILGWIITKKRGVAAIDTCVKGMQIDNCDVCQRHVQAIGNTLVNKRVKVVKAQMKGNGNK